jgi:hypothetical protein
MYVCGRTKNSEVKGGTGEKRTGENIGLEREKDRDKIR